ncbi:hypothetical protein H257_06683 [Rhizophagus irregularis DAOM 181602=DAOM 197198]|uniref:Tc1-like transposase DDE domain-containing protein n=1 Tax=Rhizophagus irregularis (strain DAOM 197198w) TaxID=1432141 RepID=A0A015KR15_RHIIW|nr:hypothetical protein RirG_090890 [Rhizophagus irregularis DAOM 197198w]GBC39782.2 hypothetical protein H257_06683 [Rhizophagus irregularis DAOM 181602=DAOM 197198]
MDISSTKGSGAPLTDNKKLMVIKVYNYFSGANSKKEDHQKVTLRKHVAEVLGIGECTVGRVQEIIDWLHAHDIAFSDELRKPELLELVRMNKEKVPFACVKIAEQYEHEVNFTLPYHCELQPIEVVWSVVKGEVARSSPHPNLLSVRNTLLNAFKEKISSKVIVGLWRRAIKNTKEYFESDENIQFTDDEFDAYSSFDDDHVI